MKDNKEITIGTWDNNVLIEGEPFTLILNRKGFKSDSILYYYKESPVGFYTLTKRNWLQKLWYKFKN